MIKAVLKFKLKWLDKITFTYKKDCPRASRTVKATDKVAK